jgi:hypothetical protein
MDVYKPIQGALDTISGMDYSCELPAFHIDESELLLSDSMALEIFKPTPNEDRATTSWRSSSYAVAVAGSPILAASQSTQLSDGRDEPPYGSSGLQDHLSLGQPSLRVSAGVERLLHHYINHVVDLMTVVSTPKGPWKSVHLPRALQGSAELAFMGKTSHACNALFHALLTISAYNLAANHSITGQELQAQHCREMALRFKAQSLTYLKAGLQSNCPITERGKYKEVLAVMLSMITIDVGYIMHPLGYRTARANRNRSALARRARRSGT